MKRLLFLAAFALAAAVGGIFSSSRPPVAAPAARPLPASSASAPAARALASSAVTAPNAANPLASLKATKACYESEFCDFPKTDPHSYSFAVGRRLAEELASLEEAYARDPSLEGQAEEAAREFMQVDDGFVQEQAMHLMSRLPPGSANVDAMIAGLEHSPDPLLVEQAMREWKRYIGSADEARIQEFLAEFIAHGGQFSSEKASELILEFLNERSLPTFEEKLASMVPESTPARYLRAALTQYKLQRQGG